MKIEHVALYVEDLERAKDFLRYGFKRLALTNTTIPNVNFRHTSCLLTMAHT